MKECEEGEGRNEKQEVGIGVMIEACRSCKALQGQTWGPSMCAHEVCHRRPLALHLPLPLPLSPTLMLLSTLSSLLCNALPIIHPLLPP